MTCQFRELAISSLQDLVFGQAPRPVHCGFDLFVGGGTVFPEVNFTLPTKGRQGGGAFVERGRRVGPDEALSEGATLVGSH
jgi:hypothetical protein